MSVLDSESNAAMLKRFRDHLKESGCKLNSGPLEGYRFNPILFRWEKKMTKEEINKMREMVNFRIELTRRKIQQEKKDS